MKSKKYIYKYLSTIINDNSCKYLQGKCKMKYLYFLRNRNDDVLYYLVQLKGNFIKAYRIKYEVDGIGINTYTGVLLVALLTKWSPERLPKEKKHLFLKVNLKDYKSFLPQFKELTPDLCWD